jgi:hypothetical protein
MSAFWGGFAGEGVKQLDKLREDNTVKLRIEDARKYQESRYSLERADRKADSIEEFNVKQQADEMTGTGGMYASGDGFMRRKMRRGADGNLMLEYEQVTDPSLISSFKEAEAAKVKKKEEDEWELRGKKARTLEDEYNLSVAPEKHSLDMRRGRADIAASERSGREKDKEPVFGSPKWEVDARNSIASGDGTYYVPEGTKLAGLSEKTMEGETSQARLQRYVTEIARILQNPSDPNYKGATKIWLRDIAPKLKKKDT